MTSSATCSAIVTAGDSGIGKATCVALARAGFDVGLTWRSDEAGALGTAQEVEAAGRRAVVAHLDLTDLPAAADVVDDLAGQLGRLDAFVNNAGTGASEPFLDTSWDTWREVLSVDLDGAFLCAQRAARRMKDDGGGRIVNVTSVHEHVPLVGSAAYCAAKGGLGLLTKVMAAELGGYGITVNAVAPGEVATPMTGNEDVDPHGERRPGVPLGRPGDAREIAALITWLCADDGAAWVTGSSFVIDGGLMLQAATGAHHLPDDSWRSP
jgi:NAD(P)-dependent dehydrogenase (short-subunit alcohol dehydrogenase family)